MIPKPTQSTDTSAAKSAAAPAQAAASVPESKTTLNLPGASADAQAKDSASESKQKKPTEESVAPKQSSPPTGKAVLIVEDERPLSHALEMKLKTNGYQTKVVVNGQEAIAAVKDGSYALMLLDLIMPLMDGFAVLEELQKSGIKLPVIVLSNLGQDEDRAKAKALGALDYFVKSNTPIAAIIERVKSVT